MNSVSEILTRRLEKLQPYINTAQLEAYRLYQPTNGPWAVAIDIYQNSAVVHIFREVPPHFMDDMEATLKKLLNIEEFFYKDRTGKGAGIPLGTAEKREMIAVEYGHKFALNLSDYIDTGLFLDHRETRHFIESQSKGKLVLNTFAYTGSFSIYAAAGGAEKTFSVDLSKNYCEWIKKNLELNDLPPEKNWVYKMDTLEFFRYAKRKEMKFDIIIIDPPTFSQNKGTNFSVERDHPAMLNSALELLNPDGFILFSNNCRDFILNKEKLSPCTVREEKTLIPLDFKESVPHHCYIIECKS